LATDILKLHDRVHEPYIRKWRAGYDADFVLRAVLHDFAYKVPQSLFDVVYSSRGFRRKVMQRLFYDYVGDETTTAQGRRLFFYTEMARYWSLALVDLYTVVGAVAFAGYGILTRTSPPPGVYAFLILTGFISRIYSNHPLDSAREITVEQVIAVMKHHKEEIEKNLDELLQELKLQGR
jgi:hypothetical protein